jgi:hypothetical protein
MPFIPNKQFIPKLKEGESMAGIKYTTTGKLKPKFTRWAKNEISKMLLKDPDKPIREISRELKIKRRMVTNLIYKLRRDKDPGALKRSSRVKNRAERARKIQDEIVAYWEATDRKCTSNDLIADLEIDQNQVFNAVQTIKKRIPEFNLAPVITNVPSSIKKKQILEYMMAHPRATQIDVQRHFGYSAGTVSRILQDIDEGLKGEINQLRIMHMLWMLDRLHEAKETCDSRLAQCRIPTQGARWMELGLMSMRDMRNLLRIGGPENEINVNLNVNKEQADAAAKAIESSIELKNNSGIKLPDFDEQQEQNVIDI